MAALILLTTCSGEDLEEPVDGEGGGEAAGADKPAPPGQGPGKDHSGPCGPAVTYDLGEVEARIPVECDPFWFYDGMPPDAERDPGREVSLPGEHVQGVEPGGR